MIGVVKGVTISALLTVMCVLAGKWETRRKYLNIYIINTKTYIFYLFLFLFA